MNKILLSALSSSLLLATSSIALAGGATPPPCPALSNFTSTGSMDAAPYWTQFYKATSGEMNEGYVNVKADNKNDAIAYQKSAHADIPKGTPAKWNPPLHSLPGFWYCDSGNYKSFPSVTTIFICNVSTVLALKEKEEIVNRSR